MIRKMNGIRREYGYPILDNSEITAVTMRKKLKCLQNHLLRFIVQIILVLRSKEGERQLFKIMRTSCRKMKMLMIF